MIYTIYINHALAEEFGSCSIVQPLSQLSRLLSVGDAEALSPKKGSKQGKIDVK